MSKPKTIPDRATRAELKASTLLSTRAMRGLSERLEQLPAKEREAILREATARARKALEDAKKGR